MVLVNSDFPHTEEFLRYLSITSTSAIKDFRQPCPGLKKFKQWFEVAPNYKPDRSAHMSGGRPWAEV
jgi:hypothetical protein